MMRPLLTLLLCVPCVPCMALGQVQLPDAEGTIVPFGANEQALAVDLDGTPEFFSFWYGALDDAPLDRIEVEYIITGTEVEGARPDSGVTEFSRGTVEVSPTYVRDGDLSWWTGAIGLNEPPRGGGAWPGSPIRDPLPPANSHLIYTSQIDIGVETRGGGYLAADYLTVRARGFNGDTFVPLGWVSSEDTWGQAGWGFGGYQYAPLNMELSLATTAIPEPTSLWLLGAGVAFLLLWRKRK